MKINLTILFIATLFFACEKNADNRSAASANDSGKGGSLTRFTIAGDYLYAVDNHFLYTYYIKDATNPVVKGQSPLNFDMETIYNFKDKLFIGTRQGLYVYSITDPANPTKLGEAKHARSCDPVVANDTVAFVTLKGNSTCGPAQDGLYIHDVKNILEPVLKTTLLISTPEGLGLQDSVLYVCAGDNGLHVLNVKKPFEPVEIKELKDAVYHDVIPDGNLLICLVSTGILLYDISEPENPVLINEIDK